MGLLYGENCVILASTVFDWSTRVSDRQTDRQPDGIAIAYTRYSYAVARKNRGLGQYGAEPHHSYVTILVCIDCGGTWNWQGAGGPD